MRALLLLPLLACVFAAAIAEAHQTFCSDPSRAGVLDEIVVRLPNNDEPAFAERMREFSPIPSMSLWEVSGSDGGVWESRDIIYQSPEVSVLILIATEKESDFAHITVERTCIDDAVEDWEPYWSEFRSFLSQSLEEAEVP